MTSRTARRSTNPLQIAAAASDNDALGIVRLGKEKYPGRGPVPLPAIPRRRSSGQHDQTTQPRSSQTKPTPDHLPCSGCERRS